MISRVNPYLNPVGHYHSYRFWSAARGEGLEPRRLLAGYAFNVLADMQNDSGYNVESAPVIDSKGDLFDVSLEGGDNDNGSIFELPAGQHTVVETYPFGVNDEEGPFAGLQIDQAGDLFGPVESTVAEDFFFELPAGGSVTSLVAFPASGASGDDTVGNLDLYQHATGSSTQLSLYGMSDGGGSNNMGLIFDVVPGLPTAQLNAMASFPANRGGLGSQLTNDAAGNLYGTWTSGGANGDGEIFEAPAGGASIESLAAFDGANGSYAVGPLLLDPTTGDLYGAAEKGGANNLGVIYQYSGGVITPLASFNGTNGSYPEGALYMDSQGDLFGTTPDGGAHSDGTVFELPAGSNTIKTLVSFDNTNSGATPVGGLVADAEGNLYGITEAGGPSGYGVIYELSPLPAVELQYAVQPQPAYIGQTLAPVTIDVEDSEGNIANFDESTVSIALTGAPAGVTLGGTLTAHDVNGVATFSNLTITAAGDYTLTASDGVLAAAVSQPVHIGLAPSKLQFVGQPQSEQVGQLLPAVTVDVLDADRNIVVSDNSTVTLSIAGGNLSGTLSAPAVNGVATFNNITVTAAGTYSLAAADGGLAAATSAQFTISPSVPHIGFSQQPTTVAAGTRLTPAVVIDLLAADGALETTSKPTKVAILTTDPTGKLLRFNATSKHGIATFKTISFKAAGAYTLLASGGSFAQTQSYSFAVTPLTASKIAFAAQPAAAPAGTPFSVQVKLLDRFGNVATGDTSIAIIGFAGSPRLATLSGTTSAAASAGLVTFSNLIISIPAKHYALKVLDGRFQAISKSFAIT